MGMFAHSRPYCLSRRNEEITLNHIKMKTKIEYARDRAGQFHAGRRVHYVLAVGLSAIALVGGIAFLSQTLSPLIASGEEVSLPSGCTKEGVELKCDLTTKETKERLGAYVPLRDVPDAPKAGDTSPEAMATLIRRIAWEEGLSDSEAQRLIDIAYCESRLNPATLNAKGNVPVGSIDVGLFQVNSFHQKGVTAAQALDPVFATKWAVGKAKAGAWGIWVCDRLIKK